MKGARPKGKRRADAIHIHFTVSTVHMPAM